MGEIAQYMMNEPMWPTNGQRTDIPDELLDDETGKAYQNCRICELDLHHPHSPYMVEKVIRTNPVTKQREVLFGYAICLECADEMKSQISQDSIQAIQEFLAQKVNFHKRMEQMYFDDDPDPGSMLGTCILSGKTTLQSREYQIAGMCEGNELILGLWPYMIDTEAASELTALLSDETLGNMDDFYGQHFGLPPEWADLFKEKPVFWI